MRGTTVVHLWWVRYMPVRGVVFWLNVVEGLHRFLGYAVPLLILAHPSLRSEAGGIALASLVIGTAISYLISLRLFTIVRSDETVAQRLVLFLFAPIAAMWRLLCLRPLYVLGGHLRSHRRLGAGTRSRSACPPEGAGSLRGRRARQAGK